MLEAVLNFTYVNIFPEDRTSLNSLCFQPEMRCTRPNYAKDSN